MRPLAYERRLGHSSTVNTASDRPDHLIPNGPTVAENLHRAVAAHRAFVILRLLAGPLNGGANDRLLVSLLQTMGIRSSSRELEDCLHRLERIGALRIEPREGLLVASLCRLGAELAEGVERNDEVEPPPIGYPF